MLNMMLGGMLIVGLFTTLTVLLRRYLLIHISQKLSLQALGRSLPPGHEAAHELFRQRARWATS